MIDLRGKRRGRDIVGKDRMANTVTELLLTPNTGWGKTTATPKPSGGGIGEQGKVRVSVASHQAVSRGDGTASPTSSEEATYGGGQSQELQPQVVWGYCLLQGLSGRPMEDLHVAEVRTINEEEVRAHLQSPSQYSSYLTICAVSSRMTMPHFCVL